MHANQAELIKIEIKMPVVTMGIFISIRATDQQASVKHKR